MRSRRRRAAVILAILTLGSSVAAEPPVYTVKIDPGVTPRRTAAEIVAEFSGNVTSVECMDGSAAGQHSGVVWIVRRSFPHGCVRSTVIDDATLEVLGYGAHDCGRAPGYLDVDRLQKGR